MNNKRWGNDYKKQHDEYQKLQKAVKFETSVETKMFELMMFLT